MRSLARQRALQYVPDAVGFPKLEPADGISIYLADAIQWMAECDENTFHAIVTDPPYGLIEYEPHEHEKLRQGSGGLWRIPPALNGIRRSPLPRFTVLTAKDREALTTFFKAFAFQARRILLPGGHLVIASNPLLSTTTFAAVETAGLEKRGELIRIVKTLRGGDRPKGAEKEFADVSVMPRACWEPWGMFRKPLSERTVAQNLRKWGAGGLRRVSDTEPFRDLFECAPARDTERQIAPHPSLKPQRLMRYIVRAVMPLGNGFLYDPFCGGGSTLAAASSLQISAVGTERDPTYFKMAAKAIPHLASLG